MNDIKDYKLESLRISLKVKEKELIKEKNKRMPNTLYIIDLFNSIKEINKKIEELKNNSSEK